MADDSGVRFILDAIACGEELKMDFKPVATYHGISLAGNASRKFQERLKVYGYKYDKDQNGLVKLDETAAPAATPTKKAPAKKASTNDPKAQKASGKNATAKKRKLNEAASENEEGCGGDQSSTNGGASAEDNEAE